MKKLILSILTVFMLSILIPATLKADSETSQTSMTASKNAELVKINVLLARLDKINEMDKSNMSRSEKVVLRKEVRTIKSQLNTLGGGVYLSVGAIIVIILLLILLA